MRPAFPTLALALALAGSEAVRADWLVFVGGSIAETEGGWEVRGRQVRFRAASGQLQSIPLEEVDLASSAFLTAAVSWSKPAPGERPAPTTPPTSSTAGLASAEPAPPTNAESAAGGDTAIGIRREASAAGCDSGRAVGAIDAERILVDRGGTTEIVRLACLDGPEANKGLEPIVHYVALAKAALDRTLTLHPSVCFEPESSAALTADENRVAYVRLADGRDLGAETVRKGYALAAAGSCVRSDEYRRLERAAAAARAGLWSAASSEAATAVVSSLPRFSRAKKRGPG